ncbi:periplasmic substrate-binding domain-containing protein [Mycoplasmopsis cricetuli]|uniref:hypothetical protein n=1 Tax=Mycoplasmopsis cricetuli TaxID=171283 RepID=UPI00046E9DC1|nr:hypothetical protein [Mycoplasmopsis cricetuli]
MKRKLFIKKTLLFSSPVLLLPISVISASCETKTRTNASTNIPANTSIQKKYDFGLVTEPINNLNYVRFKSMDRIIPSLVEAFVKSGPTDTLKSVIKVNSFNFAKVDSGRSASDNFDQIFKENVENFKQNDGYGNLNGSFYPLSDFGTLGGLGKPTGSDVTKSSSMYFISSPKNPNKYLSVTGFTNEGDNLWSNGDVVSAQDLRDYIEYILDINTASQKLDQIIKWGIRGAEEFVDAQKEYSKKFNKQYSNPWGRRRYIKDVKTNNWIQDPNDNPWKSEVFNKQKEPIDKLEVEKIKQAALKVGFYTGQLFLDYDNSLIANNLNLNPSFDINAETQEFKYLNEQNQEITITLVKNQYANPYQSFTEKLEPEINTISKDKYGFTLIFDSNKTPGLGFLLSQIVDSLYPVNRRYIETEAGGIDKYGSKPSEFLTTGAFKINDPNEDVVLGPNGFILLTKNKDYYDASNTISEKIKIYFSTDKTINSAFYEDGYISQTYIPANRIIAYWSDPVYKEQLNKNSGYGTIAYAFNLDNEKAANSYVQDQDLRNFIYYSINREDLLKVVGWDFSFPVNTWTSFGQYRTEEGIPLENFFDSAKTKTENDKQFPLQNYNFAVHLSKSYKFENTNRSDLAFDKDTAKFYLERFKAKHPKLKSVSLKFLNNSSDEQRKAGLYLQEIIKKSSNGFVEIEVKSLPENTFAAFAEEGNYDIIYQNFDRIGGNSAHDYIASFFKNDEIDSLVKKQIGFKNNPVGSWTYSNYASDLFLNQLQKSNPEINITRELVLKDYIDFLNKIMNQNNLIKEEIVKIKQDLEIPFVFNKIYKDLETAINDALKEQNSNNLITELIESKNFLANLFEYILIKKEKTNLKISRIKRLFDEYVYFYLKQSTSNNLINNFTFKTQFNDSNGQLQTQDIVLNEHIKPFNPYTGQEYQLNTFDKLALLTKNTALRLDVITSPFAFEVEARTYFNLVINSLNNLSKDYKKQLVESILNLSDINQMKKIAWSALHKNGDSNKEKSILFDFHLRELNYWRKFFELSYITYDKVNSKTNQTNVESLSDYSKRLDRFFSGNFTDEEFANGWNDTKKIYLLITLYEKIVRDAAPVIPLMEVDTNWEITKIGGVASLFRFSLQYAYDVTNPPKPGLPRQRGI